MDVIRGQFYEFHAEPIAHVQDNSVRREKELKSDLIESTARLCCAMSELDNVYSLAREDAYRLAMDVSSIKPVEEPPHDPPKSSPTRRSILFSTLPAGRRPRAVRPHIVCHRGENHIAKGFHILIKRTRSFAQGIVGALCQRKICM